MKGEDFARGGSLNPPPCGHPLRRGTRKATKREAMWVRSPDKRTNPFFSTSVLPGRRPPFKGGRGD